jgi:WYL domain
MRLFQVIFSILWGLGYLGNGILFLYVEWSFLRQSFVQVFNPLLHLQVLGVLLTTPLFWVFLAMAVVGYYAASSIERSLEQSAKRTEINAEKVIPPSSQTFQERQPNPSLSSVQSEQPHSHMSPQPCSKPVSGLETESVEPQVKLLEWAIQSSQKVQFSYEKRNGEKSDRTVTPIDFKTVEQTLCLEGYCHLRRAKRTFAIKRMRDIRIISASEANYGQGTSQEVRAPYIDVQTRVNPASQSLPSNVAPEKNADTQVKQRPYIKYHIDEIERIAASEWNNTKILNEIYYELEFRSRKKALDLRERIAARLTQLQGTHFSWSTTTSNPGSQNLPSDAFKYEEGLLRHYGYKVGMNGLPESERWEILDTVFLHPLLQMDNAAYLSEWGEPKSAKRLQKLAESIAAFTRNAKRRNRGSFSKAIQDWETDLAYLKRTYYNNRYSFQYPRT